MMDLFDATVTTADRRYGASKEMTSTNKTAKLTCQLFILSSPNLVFQLAFVLGNECWYRLR